MQKITITNFTNYFLFLIEKIYKFVKIEINFFLRLHIL